MLPGLPIEARQDSLARQLTEQELAGIAQGKEDLSSSPAYRKVPRILKSIFEYSKLMKAFEQPDYEELLDFFRS